MSDINDFPAIGFDKDRAVEGMRAEGLDGMLLTSPENVFYTTGTPACRAAATRSSTRCATGSRTSRTSTPRAA